MEDLACLLDGHRAGRWPTPPGRRVRRCFWQAGPLWSGCCPPPSSCMGDL